MLKMYHLVFMIGHGSPELVKFHEEVAVEVVEVVQVGLPTLFLFSSTGAVCDGVEEVCFGSALHQESVSHVGDIDANNGKRISVEEERKRLTAWLICDCCYQRMQARKQHTAFFRSKYR